MLASLPTSLISFISYFLTTNNSIPQPPPQQQQLTFQLRHVHAHTPEGTTVLSDIPSSLMPCEMSLPVARTRVYKPPSVASVEAYRKGRGVKSFEWEDEEISGPDVAKRKTLLGLASMAYDTYYEPGHKEWYDVGAGWNKSFPFGYSPLEDGMRGHVFSTPDNSTVVIAIKGTSANWLVGDGGPTTRNDKINDNLLFSCCCARVGPTWSTVCGCYKRAGKCDAECLQGSLKGDSLFYQVGLNLYNNITYLYPNANIWLTGHSLGGGLSSLIGATFGAPVVTFEALAERMAARRLHLPMPPETHHVVHVYHTADPIPMGTCTGVTSSCAIGGYALESRCHLGNLILLDTVTELGWSASIRTHGIKVIIDRILADDSEWVKMRRGKATPPESDPPSEPESLSRWSSFWEWPWTPGPDEPEPIPDDDDKLIIPAPRPAAELEGDGEGGGCTDCFAWEFEEGEESEANLECLA
ncbi:Alpha/Beta hydrolase protein [Cyathus striatus]|nr:Alpha/Beta hydrolase protein [Cyathus striatus]